MLTRLKEWVVRIGLMIGGVAVGGIIILLMAAFLLPDGRDAVLGADMGTIEFKVKMGDLFVAQPNSIRPPDNPDDVLSRYQLAWDDAGFRLPAEPADTFDVIALGDSYTEAPNVAYPWPDILARETGLAVRNLGFRGYGPQEEVKVLREYGLESDPDVVVLGFFGGNDLYNAGTYEARREEFVLPEFVQKSFVDLSVANEAWRSNEDVYQYPVSLNVGGQPVELAFYNLYIAGLNVTQDAIYESVNLQLVRDSWRNLHSSVPDETCVVIAYFPGKSQIYLPYVLPDDHSNIIAGQAQTVVSSESGLLIQDYDSPPDWDTLINRRNNLPAVLSDVAAEARYNFLDLTPAFEEAAARGELLYYTYDTHWNQAGHELAGTQISQYLDKIGC